MDSRSYIPFLFLTLPVFIAVFRLRSFYVEARKIHDCSYFNCSSRILGVAIFDRAIRYYLHVSTTFATLILKLLMTRNESYILQS